MDNEETLDRLSIRELIENWVPGATQATGNDSARSGTRMAT